MALSTSFNRVSAINSTRPASPCVTLDNTSNKIDNVDDDFDNGDEAEDGQAEEQAILALARPHKRLRVPSGDDDEQPAHKRTRRSPSPSVSAFRSKTLAKTSPHPFFHDAITMSIEPSSALCSPLNTADAECAICYSALVSESDPTDSTQSLARHAQCAPLYHNACLERWAAEGSPTCPNCREELLQRQLTTPVIFDEEDEPDESTAQVLNGLIVADLLESGNLGFSDEEERGVRGLRDLLVWGTRLRQSGEGLAPSPWDW